MNAIYRIREQHWPRSGDNQSPQIESLAMQLDHVGADFVV